MEAPTKVAGLRGGGRQASRDAMALGFAPAISKSRNLSLLGAAALITFAAATVPPRARAPVQSLPAARDKSARRVDWSAALLALATLSDSGIEHYRGSFHNKAMYVPLGASMLALATSLSDAIAPLPARKNVGAAIDWLAVLAGLVGTLFHAFNVNKRPGGFSWLNLFYAAPLGAPAALTFSGVLRRMSASLRGGCRELAGVPMERALAGVVTLGLLGTIAEVALMHFRGAYQNPAMYVPVTVGPAAAASLAYAASTPRRRHPITRWLLRALAAIGFIGTGFHIYGVGRDMGGWRNWSQNLLNGPPLPAPPSFTALAIAGLAALDLLERRAP